MRGWQALIAGAALLGAAALRADPPAPAPSAPTAAPVPLPKLTAAAFARLPFIEHATLSPDGTRLAGLMGVGGQQMVVMISLADHSDHPVRIFIPDGNEAHWVSWVNNDNIVVGLSAIQDIEATRATVTRMIAINRMTGKITKLKWDLNGFHADLVWVASDGSPDILLAGGASVYEGSEYWPAVYRINVETGRSVHTLDGHDGVLDWSADAGGTVRTGVRFDDANHTAKLLYRSEGGHGFREVDRANMVKSESLKAPFLFLPEGDHALVIHDDDHDHSAIYEMDMTTAKDIKQVYAAPDGQEVTHAIVSADDKTLLGAGLSGSSHAVHWFDPDLASVQDAVDKAVATSGGRRARIISLSANRQRMLVLVDRPDLPGAIYFFDTAGEKMSMLGQINPDLGNRPLASVQIAHYTARDGTPIEAILTLPTDRPQHNLPVIMLPHGGPWAHDTPDFDFLSQFIATRGYAVIQPNFRGSTGYGTAFMKKGEGEMGRAMQDDITDGLQWAAKQGIADPKRACIVGWSYGGYAAMWGIAKDPDLYRCGVSIAGVSNVRREVNDFGDFLLGKTYRDEWKLMAPDFAAISPINAIDRIKVPLLLIHGKKDITVDFSQSQKMYDRMKAAGKAVELVPADKADHNYNREADRTALLAAIERFLAAHNPADPAPTSH